MKIKKQTIIFLLPSLIGFSIFFLIPFVGGLYYALFDSSVNGHFVGLGNFADLLSNSAFLKAASNTFIFMIICVPLNMIFSLGIALLINKAAHKNNMFRSFLISPYVVPVASIAFFWQLVFDSNGPANHILSLLNLQSVDWMNTNLAMIVIIIIYLWKNMGYNVVLFLTALNNIPKVYYESASIEGANKVQQFFKITLVYLTPMTFFIFIISIINSFKIFREVYLISGGYPHESIYMIQHFMNNMFRSLNYPKLTTAAYILACIIILLVLILFVFERKISSNLTQ